MKENKALDIRVQKGSYKYKFTELKFEDAKDIEVGPRIRFIFVLRLKSDQRVIGAGGGPGILDVVTFVVVVVVEISGED
ncbi:hypothetical protein CMV_017888 [Castanea mollissima]|uniref:Uncharacterized protein n=1 Tax=Castanea mollissima TaxID=60419 RepID=A0A8J4VGP5_9ROSI|nr:hypothetical protein CMV_017888 [Castanea mollissima]